MELKRKIISRESDSEGQSGEAQSSAPGKSGSERDQLISSVMSSLGGGGAGKAPADRESDGADREGKKDATPGSPLRRRLLMFGAPALGLVLVAAALLIYALGPNKAAPAPAPAPKPAGAVSITRPIPVPDYREMLNFLVAADIQGQKTVTAFRLEIGFQNAARYRSFKENNVIFRDTVYSYLLMQNMARQTAKSWHDVLGRDLVEYLGVKLPQSRADTVKLTQIESF